MRRANQHDKYTAIDKAALHHALLQLHQCPECRRALRPRWSGEADWWSCVSCDLGWHIPPQVTDEEER